MTFLKRSNTTGSKPSAAKTTTSPDKKAKTELIPLQKPTRTFYIHPHSEWSKDVKVIDITSHINTPSNGSTTELDFTSEEFQKRTLEIGMSKTIEPIYHLRRDSYFTRSTYMTQAASSSSSASPSAPPPASGQKAEQRLADIKSPRWSHRPTTISFPPTCPSPSLRSHPTLSMQPIRGSWSDKESFVMDSVEYAWKHDRETGNWAWKRYKLVKHWSDRRVVVAKFWEPMGWKKGGTLVVDESEVDVVVCVATCLVMLMKKRQKDAERSV